MREESDELLRIRKEYERREKELPPSVYSNSNPGSRFMHESRNQKAKQMLSAAGIFPLSDKVILEVGCGAGGWLELFRDWGAIQERLFGIDLIEKRTEIARVKLPLANICCGDASQLPWPDDSFDMVLQSTVFTSVLDAGLKNKIAKEMLRVLKKGGIVLWYDFCFDNPWNPNVKGVRKAELCSLFQGCDIKLKKITLAPLITRFLADKSIPLCWFLEKVNLLNTHYLGVIKNK